MFPVLQAKLERFEELERLLQDPEVLANTSQMLEVQREYGGLGKVARTVREFNELEQNLATAREMLDSAEDAETEEYARAECSELQTKFDVMRVELEDMVTAGDSLTRGSLIMKFARARAATKRPSSPATCSRCTRSTSRRAGGSLKSWKCPVPNWAG